MAENGGKGVIGDTVKLSPIFLTGGIMSGIDFKSFLIGILIAIIFVFTTGISIGGGGKYMVSCLGSSVGCFVLNTETGVGKYVPGGTRKNPKEGHMNPGTKPDF